MVFFLATSIFITTVGLVGDELVFSKATYLTDLHVSFLLYL